LSLREARITTVRSPCGCIEFPLQPFSWHSVSVYWRDQPANLPGDVAPVSCASGKHVVALTVGRIGWRIFDRRPRLEMGLPVWQRLGSAIVHSALYALLIVIGSSGVGLTVVSGLAAILFLGSSQPLPNFASFAPMTIHAVCGFVLMGTLILYITAALNHHFIRLDRLLSRMGIGSSS
jgi:cytochrome b561